METGKVGGWGLRGDGRRRLGFCGWGSLCTARTRLPKYLLAWGHPTENISWARGGLWIAVVDRNEPGGRASYGIPVLRFGTG